MVHSHARPPLARAASCLLAGALVFLWGQPAAAAVPVSPYGVNIHAPQGPQLAAQLDRVEAAGLGWVRVDFVWAAIETQQNQFSWSAYDSIVAAAEARGIAVLGILAYTPGWATDGQAQTGVPRAVADWEDFCFRAAHRYRGRVAAWEVWNEPNLPRFWAGSREQYIERILKPGAAAIRAGDGAAAIGGPGLAHLTAAQSDWYDWLLESLQRAGDRLDFVSHHVYDRDGPGDVTSRLEAKTPFGNKPQFWDLASPSVREVLARANFAALPFWLTETGWASDEVGEGQQASFTAGLLDRWLTGDPDRSWVTKIFLYELAEAPGSPVPRWGLLRPDLTPKPAYAAVRDFIAAHPVEEPAPPTLALDGGRFAVSVRWRDQNSGVTGFGTPVPYSAETGAFWFFAPENIELLVKVLDGRPVNGKHWVFYGALSDVEYWVTVTDTTTSQTREYRNPPGTLCGRADTSAFPIPGAGFAPTAAPALSAFAFSTSLPALSGSPNFGPAPLCQPGDATLCLRGNRFAVEVAWHDHLGQRTGIGHALPQTQESGYFWFFAPGNLELVVKILDGRGVNGKFWVFYGSLSDVEYTITVTDTTNGATKTYRNPPGNMASVADTSAL